MLETRVGEVGGLEGGDAMEDAYDMPIWSTMLELELKGLKDSADDTLSVDDWGRGTK